MQNLNYNVGIFAKTVVYHYLDYSKTPTTSTASIREELFVLESKNDTSSKFDVFLCGS